MQSGAACCQGPVDQAGPDLGHPFTSSIPTTPEVHGKGKSSVPKAWLAPAAPTLLPACRGTKRQRPAGHPLSRGGRGWTAPIRARWKCPCSCCHRARPAEPGVGGAATPCRPDDTLRPLTCGVAQLSQVAGSAIPAGGGAHKHRLSNADVPRAEVTPREAQGQTACSPGPPPPTFHWGGKGAQSQRG